jgi:hypothetical protein
MLFGQLAGQDSLCGIEAGLASQSRSLYHFGVKPVRRLTLAYANEHRTHELFKKSLTGCCPNFYLWLPSTNSGSKILSTV